MANADRQRDRQTYADSLYACYWLIIMRALLELFEVISTITFVSGCLLNLLLLYLIRRFSTKDLGTYKYLLGSFVVYDTYLVVVHHIINPKVIPSRTGFAIVADREFGILAMLCFYSSCYAAPFILLNIHLLYRYWTIQAPHKIRLFSTPKFIVLLKDEERLSIRPFLFLIVADSVEIVTVCVATTLATLTYRQIRKAENISESIRTFHFRILIAASAQVTIKETEQYQFLASTPVLFVYTPYFFNVTLPIFRVYSPAFSALSMVLLSCFPCIDAVVIIVLMKPYRDGLLKMIGLAKRRELTRRLRSRGNLTLTANSLHPGVFPSELSRHLGQWGSHWKKLFVFFMKTTRDGAQTSLFVALSKTLKGVSGHYFSDCARAVENPAALDDLACKQLYDYSMKVVGLDTSFYHHMRLLLEILEITSTFTFVTGLLLSILLLYLIRRFSTKDLGTYKYLLEAFTVYDTYIVIVHHITNPTYQKVIPSHTGFGIISDREYGFLVPLLCFQSSCYAVPFALLNIHLLYRYWTINDPHKIGLFSEPKFIALLVSTAIFLQTTWFASCYYLGMPEDMDDVRRYQSYFRQEYGKDINEGPLLLNYWRNDQLCIRPLLFLIVADTVEIVTVCIAATIAALTYRHIRKSMHISETVRSFHLRILLAASAQVQFISARLFILHTLSPHSNGTITPVLFVYTPYFFNVTLPLFHIYSPTFSALSMVLVSCFPCIDAVVIIVLMKPYRNGLLRILGVRKQQANVVVVTSMATFVAGLTLNVLLLYLIHKHSTKELGTYKYLLEIFAVYDIFLVLMHFVTNPKVIPSRTGFSVVSDRDFGWQEVLCFGSSCYTRTSPVFLQTEAAPICPNTPIDGEATTRVYVVSLILPGGQYVVLDNNMQAFITCNVLRFIVPV
ncbi:hypothetical protein PRIPAC_80729 [Pristionchus pacificus]|uniref:G protein-coupled receptor n=1 Tax=Pristionchus pacificus TaxID=54126 RepID=A0A2A6CMZ6_PRIPA|nr:hypothetical protein PRIPAC_80729 [Pristionchus pacificus]|eukprot:PDM79401.1 G protein-coupled receptor [Pristionchus pacificus]